MPRTSISLKWSKYIFSSVKPLPTCPAPSSGVLGTHCHHSLNITLSVKLSKFVWVCLLSSNSFEFIHEVRHVIDMVVSDYKRYKQIMVRKIRKLRVFKKTEICSKAYHLGMNHHYWYWKSREALEILQIT